MIINGRVSLNFSRVLMVLLICLAFVSQTMAATVMPYHMISMKGMSMKTQSHDMPSMTSSSHDMATMSHNNHNMNHDSVNDIAESSEDCCVKSCSCYTGGCSSIALLIIDTRADITPDFMAKINYFSSLTTSKYLTSLYRPPIFS